MEKTIVLYPVKLQERLLKIVDAIRYFAYVFESLKDIIIQIKMIENNQHLENDLMKPLMDIIKTSPQISEYFDTKLKEQIEIDIENYLPILFNQSFVMIITVFDVFLNESLHTIIKKQPNLLKELAQEETDITVSQVVDANDYDEIFNIITNKVLRRFDFLSIDKKISRLKKIGIDTDKALNFEFHNQEEQSQFSEGKNLVVRYYNQRHEIVHQDKHHLKTMNELEEIEKFFLYLILNFGIAIGKHFKIKTDWDLMNSSDKREFAESWKNYKRKDA